MWWRKARASRKAPALDILDPHGRLRSDLWLDQPDADARIDKAHADDAISGEEAENLRTYVQRGYLVLDLSAQGSVFDHVNRSIELLWESKPDDVLVAGVPFNDGKICPLSAVPADAERGPGQRFLDIHSHCQGARMLFLHPTIHRYCELILGVRPVATQSLYFEYGSTQELHRDPWHVVTRPASHMLAAWFALEDIAAESGPLSYVPSSHRLPFRPLPSTGDIIFHDPRVSDEERRQTIAHMKEAMEEAGLSVERFTPSKGQVLIWHAALVHGGSPVIDPERTRKSFVVHFDAFDGHPSHAQGVEIGGERRVIRTQRKLVAGDRVGFDNPLRLEPTEPPR